MNHYVCSLTISHIMSLEDEMVNAIISYHNNLDRLDEVDFEPEAHYNNYGDRGVADLYMIQVENSERSVREGKVFEVKADKAIQEAKGANDILRQYNRMRRNFFEDETRRMPDYARFELCFVISETTVKHVAENFEMYMSADQSYLNPSMEPGVMNDERVVFRLPDPNNYVPAPIISGEFHDVDSPSDWKEALPNEDNAPIRVKEILDELGY